MARNKKKVYSLSPYPFELTVFQGTEIYIRKESKINEFEFKGVGAVWIKEDVSLGNKEGDTTFNMMFPQGFTKVDTITHECMHIYDDLMTIIGSNKMDPEANAYFLGNLVQRIYDDFYVPLKKGGK